MSLLLKILSLIRSDSAAASRISSSFIYFSPPNTPLVEVISAKSVSKSFLISLETSFDPLFSKIESNAEEVTLELIVVVSSFKPKRISLDSSSSVFTFFFLAINLVSS